VHLFARSADNKKDSLKEGKGVSVKMAFLKILVLAGMSAALFLEGQASAAILEGKVSLSSKNRKKLLPAENIVVYIDKVQMEKPFSPPITNPELRQRGKRFHPEVLPIMVGTTVDFPNDDTIFHNVFSLSKPKPFDLGNYKQGASKSLTFDNTGLVKVYCNIHFRMVSYILVLENPYFALTDEQGRYRIPGIPAGRYIVKAWQRFGDEAKNTVTLVENEPVQLNIEMIQDKVTIEHTNKQGRSYSSSNSRGYDG
jgi:hypothetical protein